jgi:hypothetical protein
LTTVAIAALFATSAPFWWKGVHRDHRKPTSSALGMSGGCAPYEVYGTSKRSAPNPLSTKVGRYGPNELIAVDGWVHGVVAYPTNEPPFNSDLWMHVADGTGWVSYAGVRAVPTPEDPTGRAAGGPPAPTPGDCAGAMQ